MHPPIPWTFRLLPPLEDLLLIIQTIHLDPQRPTALQHITALALAPTPQRQVAAGTSRQRAEDVDLSEELDVGFFGGGGGFPVGGDAR